VAGRESAPTLSREIEAVATSQVGRLAAISTEGLAVLDSDRRFVYLNGAGAEILRVDAGQIIGQPALVFDPDNGRGARDRIMSVPSADGARRIRHTEHRDGDHTLIVFSDTTDSYRGERQLTAFAQTATALAARTRPQDLLDDVAAALLVATGTAACTVVLYDERFNHFERVGTAGGYPDDYVERLEGCRRRGAPLASLNAYRSRKALVLSDWSQRVVSDPRWAPMHPVLCGQDWAALAAVPLLTQEGALGALTVFYRAGQMPDNSDVGFLASIAALVSVAVSNQRLLAELETKATLEERNRIARELHDSVSQMLFSLNLRSRALRRANENGSPGRRDRVRTGLDEIQELTNQALGEMRALIAQLRPVELQQEGIVGAIKRHVSAITAREDVAIEVVGDHDLPPLPADAEMQVFRIVQEALCNAVRHAGARRIKVFVERSAVCGVLRVVVEDDGHGFDPELLRPGHFGLRTMRERCEELGGELRVSSRPGRSRVVADIAVDSRPLATGQAAMPTT